MPLDLGFRVPVGSCREPTGPFFRGSLLAPVGSRLDLVYIHIYNLLNFAFTWTITDCSVVLYSYLGCETVTLIPLVFCRVPSEPLGGVKNLQVLNPTMSTLDVRWEPADGNVKTYNVLYVPADGGAESMVGMVGTSSFTLDTNSLLCLPLIRLWISC